MSTNKSSNKPIHLAVVGSGRMGQIRARLLRANPRVNLVGIVDLDIDRANNMAELHHTNAYSSIGKITDKVDGVVVSSPTASHRPVLEEAMHHGVSALFVEKPVDEAADQIQELFDLAEKYDCRLCCGFQRRFDHHYVTLADAVHGGRIGQPVAANIFFADHPVPPRDFLLTSGGDIFLDLLAHDCDFITHVLCDEVVSVYATAMSSDPELAAAGVHEHATVVLNFRGATVTVSLSRSAIYGYDQRCQVFGTKGLVSLDNVSETTVVLSNKAGVHHARLEHSFPQRFEKAFARELDAFCDVIQGIAEWPIDGAQCVRVQRVAAAARLSAQTEKVVAL